MQVQVCSNVVGLTGSAWQLGDVLEADSARLRTIDSSIFLPTEFGVSPRRWWVESLGG